MLAKRPELLRRAVRLIDVDPDLSSKEKRRRLDNLQRQRNKLFEKTARAVPADVLKEFGFQIPALREGAATQ